MTKPKYLYDVGGFYEFEYMGGSSPGTTRRIKVEEIQRSYIRGMDLDKGEYRTFTKNRIRNPRRMTAMIRVNFQDARQELVEQIRNAAAQDLAAMVTALTGREVTFDAKTGEFVTTREVEPETQEFDFMITTRKKVRLPITTAVGDHESQAEKFYNDNNTKDILRLGKVVEEFTEVSHFVSVDVD